jgi:dienelactone hydrolase
MRLSSRLCRRFEARAKPLLLSLGLAWGAGCGAGCGSNGDASPAVAPGTPNHDAGNSSRDAGAAMAFDARGSSDAVSALPDANRSTPTDAPTDSDSDTAKATSSDAREGSDAGSGSIGPYGSDGSSTVATATLQVTSSTDAFSTTAYLPSTPGPHPVVILSSGFEQTGSGYAPYANRLASWGIITLLRDDPGLLSSLTATDLASDVAYEVTTWLSASNSDSSSALYGLVDTTKIGLAGHSRGGQVALLAAEGGAHGKILGVFGLDPVDTATGGVEARTTLASVGVPLAFIGETTDSTGGVGGMPCAPAADNFMILYQAAASPAVAITSINADHTMYEDPSACTFCTLCTAGTASETQVLATAVRYLTAFFARTLLDDASVGAAFVGAGANQDVASGLILITSK